MRYAIVEEGINEDGNYLLNIEQEFDSQEIGRVWHTSIIMIYSTNPDIYENMNDEYKAQVTKLDHDAKEALRVADHAVKIETLKNGSNAQRKDIIKGLLIEHRKALKSSGHINENNKSKHKNLTKEEIAEEIKARKVQQEKNKKEKIFKVIAE